MKTALVTGANRGIGFEIVKQLSDRGFRVWLTSRDEQRGMDALLQLTSDDRALHYLKLDVSDQASISGAAKVLKQETGRLDVLINNAGIILRSFDDILTVSQEKLEQVIRINTFGPLWVTRACMDLLGKGSRVINISSGSGEICQGMSSYAPAYSISKTALNAVTCQLAHALRSKGVLVNAVCPGWVRTDMGGSAATRSVEKGAETPVWMATDPDFRDTGRFYRDKRVVSW
jgi:NAD(P)-dependent dehydrogenase (short-subunit alcohol dehydrogenase family)